KYVIITLIALFSVNAHSQNLIHYQQNKPWKALLKEAKAQDKLIFVDVYTDWCDPCKRMDKNVFSDKALAQRMDREFINYKLNAEKGMGPKLSKRYNVRLYPTYLFVNGDGTLVYRSQSYRPKPEFLKVIAN